MPKPLINRPNILFSSTSQWNVGDEFILQGVLNALEDAGVHCNPVLFNRNPAVSTPWRPVFAWPGPPSFPPENSFQFTNDRLVDYAIFAGTPEWSAGIRADRILSFIRANAVRCSFLGVGLSGPETLSPLAGDVLRNHTDVFVARDRYAAVAANAHIAAHRHTCPSILACREDRARTSTVRRLGLVLQDSRTQWQSVPTPVRDYLTAEYRRIEREYEVIYIAHYLDDLEFARGLGLDCRYSFRSADYPAFYDPCDVVIAPRVHGCGLAASLGIPSILIAHDGRAETAEGFGSIVVPPGEDLLARVKSEDWADRSNDVLRRKRDAREFYRAQLKAIFLP